MQSSLTNERSSTSCGNNGISVAVEEALRQPEVSDEAFGLMQKSGATASEILAERFGRCTRREECQRIVELFSATGATGVLHLRELLRTGTPEQASATVGLLSRFGSSQLERLLHARLPGWKVAYHDQVVRQLALGAAPERGRLLAHIFSALDRLVLPEAVDEISLCGDPSTASMLLRLGAGEMPQSADMYLRVKAIEGLGRLRDPRAIPLLREIACARSLGLWLHPEEMRIVAMQVLSKLVPEWACNFEPQSGLRSRDLRIVPLDAAELTPWARQRRYARVPLPSNLNVAAITSQGEIPLETKLLSLGGGIAASEARLTAGTHGRVSVSGWRCLTAGVFFREAGRKQIAFEISEMGLEDRARLRRLLSGFSA